MKLYAAAYLLWSLCGVRNIPLSCAYRQIILWLKGDISNVFSMYIHGLKVNVITGYSQILKVNFFRGKYAQISIFYLRVKNVEDREINVMSGNLSGRKYRNSEPSIKFKDEDLSPNLLAVLLSIGGMLRLPSAKL